MTFIQVLGVGSVILISHAIEAVTGFGCTVLALPFVTAILGMQTGVPLLAVVAWVLAVYIVITKRRSIDFKQFLIIALFVGMGLPFGIFAFRQLDPLVLKKALAVFIVLTASWRIYRMVSLGRKNKNPGKNTASMDATAGTEAAGSCPAAPEKALPRWIAYPLLVLGGIIHGAFASGGPLVVLYASLALPDKGRFRATLCLLWATLNTVLIISYLRAGTFTPTFNFSLLAVAPFLIAGIIIGEKLHNKMDANLFEKVVFGTLLATGLVMIVV